jgi:hypothetical protein
MASNIFVDWSHQFAVVKAVVPCLLSFDGATSQLFHCRSCWVLCDTLLPSKQTTHDKWISRYWDDKVPSYWSRNQGIEIQNYYFGEILSRVWEKAMIHANINAGFHATGIFSYDPDILSSESHTWGCTSRGWNMQTERDSTAPQHPPASTFNELKSSRQQRLWTL